jgi:hypothetical protein
LVISLRLKCTHVKTRILRRAPHTVWAINELLSWYNSISSLPRIDVPSLEAEARPHPKNGEGKFLYAGGRPAMEGEKTVVRSPTSQGTEACFSFRFSIFVSTVDDI